MQHEVGSNKRDDQLMGAALVSRGGSYGGDASNIGKGPEPFSIAHGLHQDIGQVLSPFLVTRN